MVEKRKREKNGIDVCCVLGECYHSHIIGGCVVVLYNLDPHDFRKPVNTPIIAVLNELSVTPPWMALEDDRVRVNSRQSFHGS